MMNRNELKDRVKTFRDKLKEYQELLEKIGKSNIVRSQLLEGEAKLREELTEEWGRLERIFVQLGLPNIYVFPNLGHKEYIFDEALAAEFSDNKYLYLSKAIAIATKAIGSVDSLTEIGFKKLSRRTPALFLSYSFRKENEELIGKIKDFLSAYPLSITTGAKPSTDYISEKVKGLINSSDYVLAVLTKDEEQKDGEWNPSKWVLDEIAYALGGEKVIIRLLEDGVNYKPGISGDAEYIGFKRDNLTGAFIKLAQILNSLPSR